MIKRLAAASAVAALLAAALGFRPASLPVAPAPLPAPSPRPEARPIVGPGRVEPRSEEIRLGTDVPGTIETVYVDEGDPVRKGQLVAALRNADLKARVAACEAASKQADLEAGRRRFLAERNAIALELSDRAETEAKAARARLDEARALLAKTEIRSPIDGVVLRRHRRAGEAIIGLQDPAVVTVADVSRLKVRVEVDESDVARVKKGARAYVTAPAWPGKRFTGTVIRVGRVLGRKSIRTDEAAERLDAKVLETMLELDAARELPIGLRVDAFIEAER